MRAASPRLARRISLSSVEARIHDAAVAVDGGRQRFKNIGKALQLRFNRFQQRDVVTMRTLAGQVGIQAQHRDKQQQFERRQDGSDRPQKFERRADILKTSQGKRDAGAIKGADLADPSGYGSDLLEVSKRDGWC